MTTILVIGTGYVGLVSGACLADFGNRVICFDIDEEKIASLKQGKIPFFEPGLSDLVKRNVEAERLFFSMDLDASLADAQVVFIAVGTPELEDGSADLTAVHAAARAVGQSMSVTQVIVQKSTVPIGTTREVGRLIQEETDCDFDMVSNPEFLREGSAIGDFLRPDRIVIGAESERARELMKDVYRPLYLNETPIVATGIETAEMIKYAANAFLATKISFINEIAELCEESGAQVQTVARAMGLDGRISGKFLHAGAGFGGSCFPKDTKALLRMGHDAGLSMGVVAAAIDANERQPVRAVAKLKELVGGELSGLKIAVLGLSFKPNTDDVREAAALKIIGMLRQEGASVTAFDPQAGPNALKVMPDLDLATDAYACLQGADALVITTEWNEFRVLDLERVASLLARPLVLDCRNIYTPQIMQQAGLGYASFGQGQDRSKQT